MNRSDVNHRPSRDGILSSVRTQDGTMLRCLRWPASPGAGVPRQACGTILICTGRSEFIEKYHEVVADLRGRGLAVVIFDWRGQGLSDRPLRNPRKGHVVHFDAYEQDMAAVVGQVLEPFCPKPWFALGHSMGGTVVLSFAARNPAAFRRLVLSAPMIEIAGLPVPDVLRGAARLLRHAGFGASFVPGGQGRSVFFETFENNVLTSDPKRYDETKALLEAEPKLALGAPTIGWLHAAFEAMAALRQEEFIRSFRTPALFVVPGFDRVVESRATEDLARRLRVSRTVIIPHAQHEILMERDVFRTQFWAAFDAFIPGTG